MIIPPKLKSVDADYSLHLVGQPEGRELVGCSVVTGRYRPYSDARPSDTTKFTEENGLGGETFEDYARNDGLRLLVLDAETAKVTTARLVSVSAPITSGEGRAQIVDVTLTFELYRYNLPSHTSSHIHKSL